MFVLAKVLVTGVVDAFGLVWPTAAQAVQAQMRQASFRMSVFIVALSGQVCLQFEEMVAVCAG